MMGRIAGAVLALTMTVAPAAAEFIPFTILQNDIQRALGRLDQRLNPKVKPKARKAVPASPLASQAPAKADDGAEDKAGADDAGKGAAPSAAAAVPLPRLRPAAAPETAIGGFGSASPAFSEADETPVGGYLAAGDASLKEAPAEDGPLAYAAGQPPLPRVNPRIAAAMAGIPGAGTPAAGKPIKLAALPPADEPADDATGMGRLNALGVSAKALPPIKESACGMADPVIVASLDNGDIPLSGVVAKVNRTLATTFAAWVRDDVEPAARSMLGAPLTGLRIADSYTCRTRDHIANAKLSEHAFGNAIDVSAFRIGKQWITVGGSHGGGQQAFLDKVRASACGPFTTVLGPGSDRYHAEHFHLDLAKRRTSGPSHGLYCH